MTKKSLVYTRTGDLGTTALVGGERVSKTDIRLESYGTVDELNSQIGLLMSHLKDHSSLYDFLFYIQNKLFTVGSYLATDPSFTDFRTASLLSQESIDAIEAQIDAIDSQLPKLNNFVLPSGHVSASQAHVCRVVCRRAERQILRLAQEHEVDEKILRFMNRLSDYLFVVARRCNQLFEVQENFWDKTCI